MIDWYIEPPGFERRNTKPGSPELRRMKLMARRKIQARVFSGKLKRPSVCERCGNEGKTEAHHPDHNKPLEVMHVCKKCHWLLH